MSEENKVIDKVNTSEIVEQPVETEEIPPVNTEPTQPVQPPVEPNRRRSWKIITKRQRRIV